MADKAGQADLRGLDINKLAVAYQQEALIFKNLVRKSTTSSMTIRWYQETSGYLTATSPAKIANVAPGAMPFVSEQSWTRNESYVKKYFQSTPEITIEDQKDNDVDVLRGNLKAIAEAVAYSVDSRIWNVMTENQSPVNINSVTATAAWDAASGQDPYEDVSEALQKIREETKREPKNPVLFVSAKGAKDLGVWITSQGTKFTELASNVLQKGVMQYFCGCRIVVCENVTDDYACVAEPNEAVVWKSYTPLTTARIDNPGMGTSFRCWEEGEAILEKPKYVALISNTET